MTKSPTTINPTTPEKPQTAPTWRWGAAFWTLIFRLLLLGIGGSLAASVGIAAAHIYPARLQEPPFAEKLIQTTRSLWRGGGIPGAQPPAANPSPLAPASPPPASPDLTSGLPAQERQQLQTELTQLQAELQTLTSQSSEPLADRVAELQKRIQSIQAKLGTASPGFVDSTETGNSTQTFVAPAQSNGDRLLVTLPSDALFDPDQTTLRSGTEAIFASILMDLQRYPDATIRIAGHTDNQNSADRDRQRSLEQAKAVQQYLSGQLGESIHWVTVGYGQHRPLATNDSPENQQRNRRIEIVIEP
ncbi:MAG: OmpA family protein [Elainella sp. Prado103]|nr:OmpA family protein [Elainella sp. Prado103]